MAESINVGSCTSSSTVVLNEVEEPTPAPMPSVRLKLKKPKAQKKKVAWTPETVDNEHMNKKKSKCCCIYEKPREFDESSSDTDDECEHCKGHVERKAKHQNPPIPPNDEQRPPSDQNVSK